MTHGLVDFENEEIQKETAHAIGTMTSRIDKAFSELMVVTGDAVRNRSVQAALSKAAVLARKFLK